MCSFGSLKVNCAICKFSDGKLTENLNKKKGRESCDIKSKGEFALKFSFCDGNLFNNFPVNLARKLVQKDYKNYGL